jgi:hypothetical protein
MVKTPRRGNQSLFYYRCSLQAANLSRSCPLCMVIEIGPMIDAKYNREALARELLGYFSNAKKTITSKYTRVHSEWKKID